MPELSQQNGDCEDAADAAQLSGSEAPLQGAQTVFNTPSSKEYIEQREGLLPSESKAEAKRIGRFTLKQWAGIIIVGGGSVLFLFALAVLFTRWLVSTEPLRDFIAQYPGGYPLPEWAPLGIPAWVGWQHFFNMFLLALIIRSGIQIKREKRPAAFWSPKNNKRRRISISMWFHQFVNIFWVANGVIYVVLLIVTAQWTRVVPTSWEVFPNAISAGLQYLSLDWPTENSWAHYNSLQQIFYFITIFVAAPLAVLTGVRMSGVWPKENKTLNKLVPFEFAKKIHFPVMIYFIIFIVIHVALVFATGALRNLNHMYAASDAVNWVGFWIFAASSLLVVAGVVLARPKFIIPLAKRFGTVKELSR